MRAMMLSERALKGHTIKNRILFCGPVTGFAHEGRPTDRLRSYYLERAKGGAGIIELEPGLAYDESAIADWSELAEPVHAYGAKLIAAPDHPARRGTVRAIRRAGLDGIALTMNAAADADALRAEATATGGDDAFLIGLHAGAEAGHGATAAGADYLVAHGKGVCAARETGIPIAALVDFPEPARCEAPLGQGRADLIGLSRQLVCDPFWPAKAELGNDDAIRRFDWLDEGDGTPSPRIRHAMNPYLGHEGDYSESAMPRAAMPKTVAVIGGGPAGMQAAITASKRGHDVMLWAPESVLGGSLLTRRFHDAARWFVDEMKRNRVDVRIGIPVTAEHIAAVRPDVVILATTDAREKALAPALREKRIPALHVSDCHASVGQAVRNGFHVAVGV